MRGFGDGACSCCLACSIRSLACCAYMWGGMERIAKRDSWLALSLPDSVAARRLAAPAAMRSGVLSSGSAGRLLAGADPSTASPAHIGS